MGVGAAAHGPRDDENPGHEGAHRPHRQWGDAGVKGDTSVATKILAEDLISVTENGVRGKKEELADNEPAPRPSAVS